MSNSEPLTAAGKLLSESTEIVIFLCPDPNIDQQAAATSIYLSLKNAGKSARLICPKLPPSDARIEGLDQIKTELGHQNLQISFDYNEDQVDKISYHIGEESKKFYLTIKPKKGVEPLNPAAVEYSYSGAEADLILTIGISNLDQLGVLAIESEGLLKDKKIISINDYQTSFGTINLDLQAKSALSELVASLLSLSALGFSKPSSSNLLLGIETQTKGLKTSNTTADTFQIVADLMRAGATRNYSKVHKEEQKKQPLDELPANQPRILANTDHKIPAKVAHPQETTVTVSRK